MTRSSRWPSAKVNLDSLAAILVTLLPLAYFNSALRGVISLASDDGILFNVPLRVAAAQIVREGSLPLWNPYIFSGMPLHAAAQGGLLFPLNWFFLVFDPPLATTLMALSTYMLAALGAYLFARRSGSSVIGAVVTSLVWQWCGFLIGQYSHVNIVQTAALLPWLLWAVDGYGARGDRKWGLILAAIVMLQAFTGHQQTLVYSLVLAAAYALVMWRATRPVRNAYLWSMVLLAAGMLLAAVQILPTYELMRNSVRARASFDFFTAFSLPPKFLLTFFAPYLMGGGDGRLFRVNYFGAPFYAEFIGYVGLGALMLAVFAIVMKRDTRTKFWAVVAAIAFVLALGRYWPFKLYGVLYYVPVINLFRVPARHLMEVDLALAVLAGRGLTALAAVDRNRALRLALMVGGSIFLVTLLIVTVGRPSGFKLAREAPVTLLRAPELFLPVVFAALSAAALIWYAHSRSVVALAIFVSVVALDLYVWGQSSGWRTASPSPNSPVWSKPPPLDLLAERTAGSEPYRILTAEAPFNPNQEVVDPLTAPARDFVFWLQPNIYMMHGLENAAGYDGFGLARYGRLAGDMAVWGQLPKPDQTLRGPGRELDLLNVRYLLAMDIALEENEKTTDTIISTQPPARASSSAASTPDSSSFDAKHVSGDDLRLPSIDQNSSLIFDMPPFEASRITLLTNLSWGVELTDGTPVARVSLRTQDGRALDFELLAGEHTSEWSYDRPDIRRQIKHRRAKVGTSYRVRDPLVRYQGHTYVSVFNLPEPAVITGGEFRVLRSETVPDLGLSVHRVSFAQGDTTFPLRTEWVSRKSLGPGARSTTERWPRVGEVKGVAVFENTRALPRAWLASSFEVLKEVEILEVIRTGSLPNGDRWDPRRTALVESLINFNPETPVDASATASLKGRWPNGSKWQTSSTGPSILVLSENFYPGWQVHVDNIPTEIIRVNYNQRGVVLGEGDHSVVFSYRPWSLLVGVCVSILTLGVLGLWGMGRLAS